MKRPTLDPERLASFAVHDGPTPVPGACNQPTSAQLPVAYCHEVAPLVVRYPSGRQAWMCVPHAERAIRALDEETFMRPPHPLMRLFRFDHLPEDLQYVFRPFARLAHDTSQSWADWDDPLLDQFMLALFQAKNLAVAAAARPIELSA